MTGVYVPLNPDDPDNDCPEVAAWFDIDDLYSMPALRPELAADLPRVLHALRAPLRRLTKQETPRMQGSSIDEADVLDYLKKHYPDGDLGWVRRCLWVRDNVLLEDVDWEQRPGGIDEDKVDEMAAKLEDGWQPHPVVLVAGDGEKHLSVADGYHRLAALDKAGQQAAQAWVGTPKPGNTGWRADVQAMQFTVTNHAANKRRQGKDWAQWRATHPDTRRSHHPLAGSRTQTSFATGSGHAPRPGMGDVEISPKMMADLRQSTAGPHMDANGHFSPERQALHDQIVRDALAGATPVKNPRLTMMGGGPASGKTVMVKSGQVKVPKNAVKVDADDLKEKIPEVSDMKAKGDDKWATASHEESSYLAARVTQAAYETKRNVLLDSTGDSSEDKLRGKIDAARAAGYKVDANYITVDPDAAVERANLRAQQTGRVVPETLVRATHASISEVFPKVANHFDSVKLFDNNVPEGSPPRLIASSDHRGGFTVHDQAAYDRFLSHGRVGT